MIRVVKPAAPAGLLKRGATTAKKHCDDYATAPTDYRKGTKTFAFASSVYASAEVKEALLTAQHEKCAFCESFVRHVGYGDVEHFRPKAGFKQKEADRLGRPGYYWLAYDWDNLFFSCQLCNQQFKKNLFPLANTRHRARVHTDDLSKEKPLLIDPSRLALETYLTFHNDVAVAVDDCPEGEATIRVLGLNRPELLEARGRRLQSLQRLAELREEFARTVADPDNPVHAAHLAKLDALLQEGALLTNEYAAMACAFLAAPR